VDQQAFQAEKKAFQAFHELQRAAETGLAADIRLGRAPRASSSSTSRRKGLRSLFWLASVNAASRPLLKS
jgi:hypothetical protein